jgi:Long-chain acyl-CoA synthetases (AMP-forming)
VERTNADLPPAARIQRFLLLHKELDADDGELTRTRKVRRRLIAERYREIVEALYGDQSDIEVETTITYQDGRTALIKTRLRIEVMEEAATVETNGQMARALAR